MKLREPSAFLKLVRSMGGPSLFPSTRKAIHLCGLLPAAPQRRDSMRSPFLARKENSSPERERRDDSITRGCRTALCPNPQVRTVVASIRPCVVLPRVGPRKITAPVIRAVNSAKGKKSMATGEIFRSTHHRYLHERPPTTILRHHHLCHRPFIYVRYRHFRLHRRSNHRLYH